MTNERVPPHNCDSSRTLQIKHAALAIQIARPSKRSEYAFVDLGPARLDDRIKIKGSKDVSPLAISDVSNVAIHCIVHFFFHSSILASHKS